MNHESYNYAKKCCHIFLNKNRSKYALGVNIRNFLCLPVFLLLSGCIGLAMPLPHTSVSKQIISNDFDYENPKYLPREIRATEQVAKDKSRKIIEYRTSGGCFLQVAVVPYVTNGCRRIETWDYSKQNEITVKTHSHHMFGFWCSPIPFVPLLMLTETGTAPVISRHFPFCEIQFGQTMNTNRLVFPN